MLSRIAEQQVLHSPGLAAIRAARNAGAASVDVAAPIASDEASALVGGEAEATVILKTPAYLFSIGHGYDAGANRAPLAILLSMQTEQLGFQWLELKFERFTRTGVVT